MTTPPRCGSQHPIPCVDRKAAMRAGQFFYLWGIGWLWLQCRDVTIPWERCPWCNGVLPTMEDAIERILRNDDWGDL